MRRERGEERERTKGKSNLYKMCVLVSQSFRSENERREETIERKERETHTTVAKEHQEV